MAEKNNEESKLEQRVPDIILDFEYTVGQLYIIVENIGKDSAYNINVEFNKKILGMKKTKNISSLAIFRSLKFCPPNKKIKIFVDSFQSYLENKQPMKVNVKINFTNKFKKKFENSINHDLTIYKDIIEIHSIKNIME